MTKTMRWTLVSLAGVIIMLCIATPCVAGREETVSLTFRQTALTEDGGYVYRVRPGDTISEIIHDEFGVSYGEIYHILDRVRKINPQIKDINVIHVGQKIRLPGTGKSPATEPRDDRIAETGETEETVEPLPAPGKESPPLAYTVQIGDSVSRIIHRELGIAYSDMWETLKEVKRLNPHIRDINVIQPGDIVTLPGYATESPVAEVVTEEEETVTEEEPVTDVDETPAVPEKPFLSMEQELEVIDQVVSRMDGSVMRDGAFYIPLPPGGQMSIDCTKVPIVEFDGGTTLLLDFSSRVPDNLKHVIESTWKTYRFIREKPDSDAPSMLEGVIDASSSYRVRKTGTVMTVGRHPGVDVLVDWVVSRGGDNAFAINLLDDQQSLLPGNILTYTERSGLEIIEILKEQGMARSETVIPPRIPTTLTHETNLQLAALILSTLGHVAQRDTSTSIFDMERDGFNLSVKTDLSLRIDDRDIVIVRKKLPRQFLDILEQRGTTAVMLSKTMKGETVVEQVLRAVKTPFLRHSFTFPLAGGRGTILLPAIRALSEGGLLYFINYDIDSDIYGLLYEEWEVNAVRY